MRLSEYSKRATKGVRIASYMVRGGTRDWVSAASRCVEGNQAMVMVKMAVRKQSRGG